MILQNKYFIGEIFNTKCVQMYSNNSHYSHSILHEINFDIYGYNKFNLA